MWTATQDQIDIINSPERFKVTVAGRRWGKTHLALLDSFVNKEHGLFNVSNSLIWYVSPTYKQSKNIAWALLKNMIYTYRGYLRKKPNESDLSVELINGSKMLLKGADNEDSLRGVGLNHIILDEFQKVKKDAWTEVLRPTLTDKQGTAMFIGTPDGFNYFYDLYNKGLNKEDGYRSWKFKTIDSPFIEQTEIEAARNELDERTFRQEYEASFETMSGRVYYAFGRENIQEQPFNRHLPIKLCVDFNVNPMCWEIVQTYDGEIDYAIDEISMRNTNTEEAAREFRRRYPESSVYLYGDYSGNHRHTSSPTTDYEILKEIIKPAAVRIQPNPLIIDRINSFNARLKNAKGQRRLFISPKCKELIKDLEQVQYKEGSREIDKMDKERTHSSDGLGYYLDYEYSLKGKSSVSVGKMF